MTADYIGEKIDILGIQVDRVTMEEALDRFEKMLESPGISLIVTPNSEILENATKNPLLMETIGSADLVIPDGIGLVYASKMLGKPLKERVTGIDFSWNALRRLASLGKSAYFFGSKPGIAQLAAEKAEAQIPGLKVAGCHDGYFKEEEEGSIVEDINRSGADFLLVALGSPKQELFVRKHQDELQPKVAIGVGGSLDVWSGSLKRAPQFYIDHGLEWLYRIIQEPKRIKRTASIPAFLIKVMKSSKR